MKLQLQESRSLFDSQLHCPFFVQMMKLCERDGGSLCQRCQITLSLLFIILSPWEELKIFLPFHLTRLPPSSSTFPLSLTEPCWTTACWTTTLSCTKTLPICWGSARTRRPSSCSLTGTKPGPRTSTATPDRCWQLPKTLGWFKDLLQRRPVWFSPWSSECISGINVRVNVESVS